MACKNRCGKFMSNFCLESCSSRNDNKNDRENELVAKWIDTLPCKDCPIYDLCKYVNSVNALTSIQKYLILISDAN